ncbi:MAG: hypothetical protein ACLP3B_22340 [Syntrophobacteraceae bacterium]
MREHDKYLDRLAESELRAAEVYELIGQKPLPPIMGEPELTYRRRLASRIQQHSPKCKNIVLDTVPADAFSGIETILYEDVAKTAGSNVPVGKLIPHVQTDVSGRRITTFTGDIGTWMAPFKGVGHVVRIRRP